MSGEISHLLLSEQHTGTAPNCLQDSCALPAPHSTEPSATSTVPTEAQPLPPHHTHSKATSCSVQQALADVIKQLGPLRALFLTTQCVCVHPSQEICCCWTNLASKRERKNSNPNLIFLEHQFLHFIRELRRVLCELRRILQNWGKAVAKTRPNPLAGGRTLPLRVNRLPSSQRRRKSFPLPCFQLPPGKTREQSGAQTPQFLARH